MSKVDIQNMFDSIKESLNNDKGGNSSFRNILKFKAGNTYLGRIIPNIKEPKETFFHYFHHGFTSNETGQYVDGMCLTTWNERCPVCEERFKLWKTGTETNKDLARLIRRLEKHYVNFYVIDDPTNEENNGTVKILRCGVRLYEKIEAAVEGDDSDEFGSRVFDLSENGCNLKIKVETTTGDDGKKKFTNYSNSRFTSPGAIPGMTPDRMQEVYDGIFDLPDNVDRKTVDELKEMMDVHVFCKDSNAPKKASADAIEKAVEKAAEITDKQDTEKATVEDKPEKKTKKKKKTEDKTTVSNDDKIKDLLAGIDDIPEE